MRKEDFPLNQERVLSRVRFVLTDWNGVISDDRPVVYETNMRMRQLRGIGRVDFASWLPDTRLSAYEYFLEVLNINVDRGEILKEFFETYGQVKEGGVVSQVYQGARDALRAIHESGRRIEVISTHDIKLLLAEADEFGITPFISAFTGNVTDKSLAIKSAYSARLYSPSETLYMGDTIYDVRAAKTAGVMSVGMATGYHSRKRLQDESPEYVFDSLTELTAALLANR